MTLRFLTAGESHGPCLTAIVEGLPAGLTIDLGFIHQELAYRQHSLGRSARMTIENDEVKILSGIRHGKTLGYPITFQIKNNASQNLDSLPLLLTPRPGHGDLVGTLKFKHNDIRNALERSSARETAIRTSVGALCQIFLKEFGIECLSFVSSIGPISIKSNLEPWKQKIRIVKSPLFCPDNDAENKMVRLITQSQKSGESLGGTFEVNVRGLPIGLGSFSQWDQRLDGRLAQAIMAIPAIKGVEIGDAILNSSRKGSSVHEQIFWNKKNPKTFGFYRNTNRSGGLEAGVTTGEELIVRGFMKPLSTLSKKSLNTVHMTTKKGSKAIRPRTDTCAVPAASVVARNTVAIEIAKAFLEKFGGDSLLDVRKNFKNYLSHD